MEPIILFRKSLEEEGEFDIAKKYLNVTEYRSQIPPGSLVIPRYSCLPFYEELESELAQNGSMLINSYRQHQWIADVMAWAGPDRLLEGRTPKTWDRWVGLPPDKSFVVKGKTNSRKNLWSTHCFCPTVQDVPKVAMKLLDDTLIGPQGLVVREYIPLVQLAEGINGQPITNEWRTFFMANEFSCQLLAHGFYWGTHPEQKDQARWTKKAEKFAHTCANMIAMTKKAKFFVLDIAETWKYADPELSDEDNEGDWILIEVNDGGMSGLGFTDPEILYSNLAKSLAK